MTSSENGRVANEPRVGQVWQTRSAGAVTVIDVVSEGYYCILCSDYIYRSRDGFINPFGDGVHDRDLAFLILDVAEEKKDLLQTTLHADGYDKLADVFRRAFEQASEGKGKERHANEGVPFEIQPMSTINIEQGSIDGFLYQARKKCLESKRLPDGRAQAELLGALNYIAGAVIALDSWAKKTLPES